MVKRVAVIGAGAAGLASARWLLDAKLEPVVFERTNAVGGLWRPDTGLAYPSLRTNTSKQTTAFSDLPFDDPLPDHPFRDDVLAYLERYADLVDVRPRIRFGRDVTAVRPASRHGAPASGSSHQRPGPGWSGEEGKRWRTTTGRIPCGPACHGRR